MAFVKIEDESIEPESKLSSEILFALRDNLEEALEGDLGADTPNLMLGIGARTATDSVGTPVFAYSTGGNVAYGGTVAGSTLRPASAARSVNVDASGAAWEATATLATGSALTGTWICLGHYDDSVTDTDGSSNVTILGATLWVKILD